VTTCPVNRHSPDSASTLTAAVAALGLTLLFFWGLAVSSEQLQAPRPAPAASAIL